MASAATFSRWLDHQQPRHDPVGSLARYIHDEVRLPRAVGPARLQALLTRSHAPPPLRATLDWAMIEWAVEAGHATLAEDAQAESWPN
ncbi:MAG: hypothetical protein ACT4PI_02145 [Actinomycetota bacterium]